MNFFVDISDSNSIVLHEADCKMINEFRKNHIPNFHETYEEAREYAHQKEIIYDFKFEECLSCRPKDKLKLNN